jgi:hypothetical protein
MVLAPDGDVVEKAERKSQDLLQNYLMTEASAVHELHAPLVNFKKPRKDRILKEKKEKKKKDKEKKKEISTKKVQQ